MFSGFGQIFPEFGGGRSFKAQYRCYPVAMLGDREDVERGGKIIMPPSALDTLTRLHIQYPMLFKLTNSASNRHTHCGVLEFVADEGKIYLPYWMMQNLMIDVGGLIDVDNVSLSVATFAKFQPQSVDFIDITNPKAVLENALRTFACLTASDVIAIKYNEKIYELCVLEVKPGSAVSIIECDMNVDFAPPVGYQDPSQQMAKKEEDEEDGMEVADGAAAVDPAFRAFSGSGNRLDGKKKGEQSNPLPPSGPVKRGIPNYDYKKGTITFIRSKGAVNGAVNDKKEKSDFEAFSGDGQSLRRKGRK